LPTAGSLQQVVRWPAQTWPWPAGYAASPESSWPSFTSGSFWPGRSLSETKLLAASPSSTALSAPSTLAIAFTIEATLADNVIVGAALQPTGSSASAVAIAADDRKVALAAGSNTAVRSFDVPAGMTPGSYDLTAAMWRDMNRNGVIDVGDQHLGTLTYPNAITVAATRKRASH